ncbi:protein-glutamate methylesterase/protein-glutamine glutaminase [Halobacillus naozhouensis]|uniref:Protein-glutamate methylesterase/protein-glutamine glutaminase n=1 Tax=Halobacillus naozhouensis TaxID=554880 RepID=A0ABY8J3U3_9BACI|nr:chemotaxis response regulator protein-glutamate methylesterase [Halobacillus naozhouensis]WFT76756.1 chemotaxis response regulator protein-glutamate methylesterase [Halobacillus naozhouensis]
MKLIKVLVVDDSAFMRKMITDLLEKDKRIKVVGTARNGKESLIKAKDLLPDVITMDIEMPVMDGLTALAHMMKEKPKPVVMLSSLTSEGADSTLKAMSLGAVDFVLKPSGSISLDIEKVEKELHSKVITASKASLPKRFSTKKLSPLQIPLKVNNNQHSIVAIGTSTGGPRALQEVITHLPADFPAPILIVQHMPKGFTLSLANRLDQLAAIHVKEAEEGEKLRNGVAYIAPGDFHMGVILNHREPVIALSQDPPHLGHRPAVNHLYKSLANLDGYKTVAVVMTGMGSDGMDGLLELKRQCPQTYCIAESADTCIVYGMPKAVILAKLANEIVPLDDINHRIGQVISGRGN